MAEFKIVYTLQDQLSQISAYWDWFGHSKSYFSISVKNKLSPLVADLKIGSMNSAYTLQDQLSQILAHLDWFGHPKFYFCSFGH